MSPDQRLKRMEFNGTFLATIITFILFVFIMNRVLYRPILGIMEERKNFIDSNYKSAKENDSKTDELCAEKEAKLNDARDNARGKYLETVEEFKTKKADIVSDAQKNSADELDRSRAELQQVSDEVKNGLKASMNDLANDIVEKVIGYRSEIEGFDDNKVNEVLWGGGK